VHPDVSALLDVQTDDLHIYSIEDKLSALAPRLAALEKDRQKADAALADVRTQIETEEKKQREVQDRVRQHRELRDKSENLLGQVSSPREAAAAMAQIDQAKRFIADEERELETIGQRLVELRRTATEREHALQEIGRVQQETRTSLESDRVTLEKELADARSVRDQKAGKVPRSLMQRYDRIRQRRRSTALYALRGQSCAHCDTVIPVQRRNTMAGTGATELCEGCGVLLYAAE
jgi:predicted  nucleic acid-binding Zn-ribbon protein